VIGYSKIMLFWISAALFIACGFTACSSVPDEETRELSEGGHTESAGEHEASEGSLTARFEGEDENEREGEEHGEGEENEESGVYINRSDTWDATRRGARLVLTFDPESNAFSGTVENATESSLCSVRVEVHLSNGVELGPTARKDLPAHQFTQVELSTGGEAFDTWTAHPEVSRCPSE